MNLFLIGYLGAFIKWMFHGFKTKISDEYYWTKDSKRIFKSLTIDTENSILGYAVIVIILLIIIFGLF